MKEVSRFTICGWLVVTHLGNHPIPLRGALFLTQNAKLQHDTLAEDMIQRNVHRTMVYISRVNRAIFFSFCIEYRQHI
jgi:hypothetical protein